jgi:polyisoprenoid-binding protein YceI
MATTEETGIRTVEGLDAPAPGTFTIDLTHTHIGFVVRHMMVSKVRWSFSSFSGEIVIAEDPLKSSVEVSIDTKSIDTHDENRDNHLRSADFFEIETHPTITFKSTAVTPTGPRSFNLSGDLTIHGVTHEVTLETDEEGIVQDPYGNQRIGFSASAEIDREEFGLTYNAALEAGGVVIGKTIKLEIEVEAIRKA